MNKAIQLIAFIATLSVLISSVACVFIYEQQSDSATQTIMNVPYSYVDNNNSDVDSSPDVGTHSNFENEKLRDGVYDTLTESAVTSVEEIIRDGVTQQQSASATINFSHTLGYSSSNNRLVVVAAGFEHNTGDINILNATYNGQSMTKIVQATNGGIDFSSSTAIFYILDSNLPVNSGSYYVVVTCASDPAADLWASAVSYIGVKQEAPDAYDSDSVGTPTTLTSQLNCDEDGSILVQACVVGNTGSFAPSIGTTEVIEDIDISSASAVFNEKLGQDLGMNDIGATHSNMNRGSWVGACWAPASGDTDYNLDLEVQWTNIDYSETNEELCIYHAGSDNSGSLDATGGYMIVGDGTPDWGSTTGTISFWVKMDLSVQGRFWGQNGDMETRWSGTYLVLDWGGVGSMTSTTSFSPDTWYFVAIVWDENNNNLFLYVGDDTNPPTLDANSLSGTWISTTPLPTQNLFMNGVGASQPVDGHGDDLRYWNTARSLAELQSDYNVTLTGSETSLRSYFRLNNNFDDIGPDNNDGSASGSYSFSTDTPFNNTSTESIRVDVWTGSEWQNVLTILGNGWNNASITSYLVSSTLTFRFKGNSETSDSTQDSWNIDSTVIHAWT